MVRRILAFVLTLLVAGCGTGTQLGTAEGGRPTTIATEALPADQVTLLSSDRAIGVRYRFGRLDLVSLTRDPGGRWVARILTSTRASRGQDSLHLISYGGTDTGEEWNTYVYGTAGPGVDHVALEGFPEARGGKVASGVWVIALREKDVTPAAIRWKFVATDGSVTSGEGIFPPEA